MAHTTPALYTGYAIDQPDQQPALRWANLVERVSTLPYSDPQVMAYTLTMRRLGRVQQARLPHHNIYCPACASRLVANYKGNEQELLDYYYRNLKEILHTLDAMLARAHQFRLERVA